MRIVSQDRKTSVNFDRVVIEIINEKQICAISHTDHGTLAFLGSYETSERAKEIFRDIHNAYSPVGLVTCALAEEEIKQFIGSENVNQKIIMMPEDREWVVSRYGGYVYYMPEQ